MYILVIKTFMSHPLTSDGSCLCGNCSARLCSLFLHLAVALVEVKHLYQGEGGRGRGRDQNLNALTHTKLSFYLKGFVVRVGIGF